MTDPDTPPALRIQNLSYRYPDGRDALRGIDLEIPSGQRVALIGPNGAGKSTLLWHFNGLLPGFERRGLVGHHHGEDGTPGAAGANGAVVQVDGLVLTRKNAPEIRRRVGLLFQDPDDQLFRTNVLDDVAFGPRNRGLDAKASRRLALACLERVGLAHVADRPPHHLSFGERKRVALAGILACEPTLYAFDEPTANLDPRSRRQFIELIAGLGSTLVLATHDLEMALAICDRAVILDRGTVAADGTPETILADAELMDRHGLEVPLSLQLRAGRAD